MRNAIYFSVPLTVLLATACSSPPDPGPGSDDAQADVTPQSDAGKDGGGDASKPVDDAASDVTADVATDVAQLDDGEAGSQGVPCNADTDCGATEACPGLAATEGASEVCTPSDETSGESCAAAPSAVTVDGSKVVYLDYAFDSSSTRTDTISCTTNPPANYVEQVFTVDVTKGGTYEIWSNVAPIAVLEGTQCPGTTCFKYVGAQVTTGGTIGAQTLHIIAFRDPSLPAARGHVEIIPQ